MEIDATTRRNLEIVQTLRDGREEGSLLHFLDRTATSGGKRLLREWLVRPLCVLGDIQKRHDSVETLCASIGLSREILEALSKFCDLERAAARLDLGIISPRELASVGESLNGLRRVTAGLEEIQHRSIGVNPLLKEIAESICEQGDPGDEWGPVALEGRLSNALIENPPYVLHEGGIFIDGYDPELDRLRTIRREGRSWIAALEAQERETTGIASLKIRFNNALGYFFEVTRANQEKVPEHYVRRQTMTNASRFVTEELKKQEEEILGAKGAQIALERKLFDALRGELQPFAVTLRRIAAHVAMLDVLVSFAVIADEQDYTRPILVEDATMKIVEGRHPVLSHLLEGRYVPNSLHLGPDEANAVILTGANMGGKSTYLRQAGLIALLSHCGSFVPAKEAVIGLVDRIFARLGASDDMAEGESTFMVEMREASHILSGATPQSLVLIDEIGRGTATTDGLAIAQSILEWIVERINCRTLFATHFHELTELERKFSQVQNFSVGSVDRGGEVHFTHQICAGPANRSYGIEVARLAALPDGVLSRARKLLDELHASTSESRSQQLSFFEPAARPVSLQEPTPPADYAELQELRSRLTEVDVQNTTPVQALLLLQSLQEVAGNNGNSSE
jgi:DNA mismatch repair protein MutS